MQWYLAKIIFRIICGQGNHTPQFDEQVRLVAAHNDRHAFDKANEIGLQEATSFYNQQQQLVQWKFIAITELYRMNDLIENARTEGEFLLDGENIYDGSFEVYDLRKRIGMVFQRSLRSFFYFLELP